MVQGVYKALAVLLVPWVHQAPSELAVYKVHEVHKVHKVYVVLPVHPVPLALEVLEVLVDVQEKMATMV
jgi:hypothetical protein